MIRARSTERAARAVQQVKHPVLCHGYAHPATAPPPASRPYALLPGLFTQSPWGVSQPTFEGQPPSPPNPLGLTSLPLCLSSRLSCSPVPFLQRYGAADLLDAALQLHMRLEHELVVPFGMSSRHGVLLRAFRAPALADRCPIAALDAEALLPVARVGGRAALCAPLCLPTGQHWHAYGSQRRRTWLGRLVVRQEHCVSVF